MRSTSYARSSGQSGRCTWRGQGMTPSLDAPVPRTRDPRHAPGQNCHMSQPADKRVSFDEAVESYDKVRPTYPPALFDALFNMLSPGPQIVEVGPGTGKATRDLLARGASVHAIELGPAMATKLRANLPTERLHVTIGDFERADVVPASADALFSATAYHWISVPSQTDRPAAILRTGGVMAIVDTIQVESSDDGGFFAAVQPIYEKYGEGHRGPPAPTRLVVDPPIRAVLEADPRFGRVAVRRFDWNQTYTASKYRDLMLSYSSTQMMEDSLRLGLLDDIESFVGEQFGGVVTRPLVVTLTTAVLS